MDRIVGNLGCNISAIDRRSSSDSTLLLLQRGGSLCHLFCKRVIPDNALGLEAALEHIKVQEEGDEWTGMQRR